MILLAELSHLRMRNPLKNQGMYNSYLAKIVSLIQPELVAAISRPFSSNLESIARISPRTLFINLGVLIGEDTGAPHFIGCAHIKESGKARADVHVRRYRR